MKRDEVDSECLRSIGHDAKRDRLELEFHSRAVYQYDGVSKRSATNLKKASSIGGAFNDRIRDKYPYRKVRNAAKKRRSFKPKRRR